MINLRTLLGLAAGVAAVAGAAEYKLEFKTLGADEAWSFAGGPGVAARLSAEKPGDLKKAPPAVSSNPLYGRLAAYPETNGFLLRLDEAKGTGRGYDQFIIDLNENGDLTDDAVTAVNAPASAGPRPDDSTDWRRTGRFGPIVVPETRRMGEWKPIYYAEASVYRTDLAAARKDPNIYVGFLRLKAGWFLETVADFGTHQHKLAFYDANSNLRLGDRPAPRLYNDTNWYFSGGDTILVDANNSGTCEVTLTNSEASPMGPLLYHGPTPCRVALADGRKSVRLDPYEGPLAEVLLKPLGEQVESLSLAWEETKDQWQLLKPEPFDAAVRVPPGRYRLTVCQLRATGTNGIPVFARGYKRTLQPTILFEAGRTNFLLCGAPLAVNVTASGDGSASAPAGEGLKERLFAWLRSFDHERAVHINAEVTGRGGEVYSSYSMGLADKEPSKPRFTVTGQGGKQIASGNLEFG
jgi:hypothetical protein